MIKSTFTRFQPQLFRMYIHMLTAFFVFVCCTAICQDDLMWEEINKNQVDQTYQKKIDEILASKAHLSYSFVSASTTMGSAISLEGDQREIRIKEVDKSRVSLGFDETIVDKYLDREDGELNVYTGSFDAKGYSEYLFFQKEGAGMHGSFLLEGFRYRLVPMDDKYAILLKLDPDGAGLLCGTPDGSSSSRSLSNCNPTCSTVSFKIYIVIDKELMDLIIATGYYYSPWYNYTNANSLNIYYTIAHSVPGVSLTGQSTVRDVDERDPHANVSVAKGRAKDDLSDLNGLYNKVPGTVGNFGLFYTMHSYNSGFVGIADDTPGEWAYVQIKNDDNMTAAHELGHLMNGEHHTANSSFCNRAHTFSGLLSTMYAGPNTTLTTFYSNPNVYVLGSPTGTSTRNNAGGIKRHLCIVTNKAAEVEINSVVHGHHENPGKGHLFPNPAQDYIQLTSLRGADLNIVVDIISMDGLVVEQKSVDQGRLSIVDLAPGFYYVRANSKDYRDVQKFVKH